MSDYTYTIAYGFIATHIEPWETEENEHNKKVIANLPNERCYLCRDMFGMLHTYNPHITDGLQFFHFAAQYRYHDSLDEAFLEELEDLLSKLYWSFAEFIDLGSGKRYVWEYFGRPNKKWERTTYSSVHELEKLEVIKVDE